VVTKTHADKLNRFPTPARASLFAMLISPPYDRVRPCARSFLNGRCTPAKPTVENSSAAAMGGASADWAMGAWAANSIQAGATLEATDKTFVHGHHTARRTERPLVPALTAIRQAQVRVGAALRLAFVCVCVCVESLVTIGISASQRLLHRQRAQLAQRGGCTSLLPKGFALLFSSPSCSGVLL